MRTKCIKVARTLILMLLSSLVKGCSIVWALEEVIRYLHPRVGL